MTSTLNDHRNEVEVARDHGWEVGTRLVGDEGYGPTIIEITALGLERLLARTISHNGVPVRGSARTESPWVLYCRDWRETT